MSPSQVPGVEDVVVKDQGSFYHGLQDLAAHETRLRVLVSARFHIVSVSTCAQSGWSLA